MKEQIFAIILILALTLSMFGCDAAPTDPTAMGSSGISQPTTEAPTTQLTDPNASYISIGSEYIHPEIVLEPGKPAPDEEMNITVQYLPEMVENPDNLPVLKWLCLVNSSSQTWTEDAVHEMNQMLADRDMPFRVQFVILSTEQIYYHSDWFSRSVVQEVLTDADLIYGWMTADEQQKYLSPITEYVTGEAQPSLKNAVVHELNWLGATVGGEIYGIQTRPLTAYSSGWCVAPEALAEYDLTLEDFDYYFWEMDEIFAKIYEANGNEPFLQGGYDGYSLSGRSNVDYASILPSEIYYTMTEHAYQLIGACFAIDYSAEVPTVVNTLETDYVRSIWEAIMRYKDAGYITTDPEKALVSAVTTTGEQTYTDSAGGIYIPVTPVVFDSQASCYYVSGVADASRNKEEAITLLNLIAEDEEFRNQLCFGKEGRDYTLTGGEYAVVKQEDGSCYNMEFLTPLSDFSTVMEKEAWPIPHEGKTKRETYLDNLDSVTFCCYPIVFDYTGFEQEIDEMEKIFNVYFHFFTNDETTGEPGTRFYRPRMTEELYDQMLQELKDAGSDKIIAELQRQLDAWLAENPDW